MAREKKAIAITPRRARVRRARQIRLALLMGMAAVILVGLIGLGVWLLLGPKPEATIEVYPMAYEAQIRLRASENGLDPAYPAAVILAESPGADAAAAGHGGLDRR